MAGEPVVSTRVSYGALRRAARALHAQGITTPTRSAVVAECVRAVAALGVEEGVNEVEAMEWCLQQWPTTLDSIRNLRRAAVAERLQEAHAGGTSEGPTMEEVREALRHFGADVSTTAGEEEEGDE